MEHKLFTLLLSDQCNEEDWIQNDKTCYKFYLNTKARWNEASSTCAMEGASLGVFNKLGKLHFVKDFVRRQNIPSEQILVGLRQVRSKEMFLFRQSL